MKNTVGTRVGYLYDKLANPAFHGPKAETLMKEYVGLTRHPDKPDMAYFLFTKPRSSKLQDLTTLIFVAGGVVAMLMWIRLIKRSFEASARSSSEAADIRKRVMEILEEDPEINLPEDFFDGLNGTE